MAIRIFIDFGEKKKPKTITLDEKGRGKWPNSTDFIFACVALVFRLDAFLVLPSRMIEDLGFYFVIPYFLLLAVGVFPVVFLQTFLGQFSSTGFISALKISPIFKSIGYIGLVVNVVNLTYSGLYGAIPLLYLAHTLEPTMPWSCEGSTVWMNIKNETLMPCYENCTLKRKFITDVGKLEFFRFHLDTVREYTTDSSSIWVVPCAFIVWFIVGVVLIQPMEIIAEFLRYTCMTVLTLMGICLVGLANLPAVLSITMDPLVNARVGLEKAWGWLPIMTLSVSGFGWGNILTMASFNKFKEDTVRSSWLVCLAQSFVMFALGFMVLFAMGFLRSIDRDFNYNHVQWLEFLITPGAQDYLGLSRVWCFLFFLIMFLGALNLLTVQLFSVLTSVFDEFEHLRVHRRAITVISVAALALCSIPFCFNQELSVPVWNHTLKLTELLPVCMLANQVLLNILLVFVVLWIYGRKRFLRDIAFMTGLEYAPWKVNVMRYLTPLFLLPCLLVACFFLFLMSVMNIILVYVTLGLTLMLWLFIPGNCCFAAWQFKQCGQAFKPKDWYPADPEDRQKYKENLNEAKKV